MYVGPVAMCVILHIFMLTDENVSQYLFFQKISTRPFDDITRELKCYFKIEF